MICTNGYTLPSNTTLSLPIARLSHEIFITLVLHGLDPHSSAWLPLNYGRFKAYTPIYFNDDPTDRITDILEASAVFDDLVTQPSIYGFDDEDDIEQVCRGVTPCEEDIDMIDPRSIVNTPLLDPQERPVEPRVPFKNRIVIEIPECQKWEWIGGWSNNEDTCYSDHDPSEGSSNYDGDASEEGLQHRQPHYPRPETQHEEYLRMLRFHRTIDSTPSVIIEAICQHDSDERECMDDTDNDLNYDSLYLSCINTDM